jgi:hypothetical protein
MEPTDAPQQIILFDHFGAFAGWGLHPLESAAFARRMPGHDSRVAKDLGHFAPSAVVNISDLSGNVPKSYFQRWPSDLTQPLLL